jgi:choline kinase
LAADGSVLLVVDRKRIDGEAEKVALQHDIVCDIGKDVGDPYGEFIGIARFSGDAVSLLVETLEQIARKDLGVTFPQLVHQLIQQGQDVKVLATDRPWFDIDFPRDLEEAQLRFPSGT